MPISAFPRLVPLLVAAFFFQCSKSDRTGGEEPPPKTFTFPLTLNRYEVIIDEPVRLFVSAATPGHPTLDFNEIPGAGVALTTHPIFNNVGTAVCNEITFESEMLARIKPTPTGSAIKVTKATNEFRFAITQGINSSCQIAASGDYDDLTVSCQVYASIRADGSIFSKDYFRDPCFQNQAFDTDGDTVAILNYSIRLK